MTRAVMRDDWPEPKRRNKGRMAMSFAATTLAHELDDEARWLRWHTARRGVRSTSIVPRRCPGCQHWNSGNECRECRTRY